MVGAVVGGLFGHGSFVSPFLFSADVAIDYRRCAVARDGSVCSETEESPELCGVGDEGCF